MKGFLFAKNLQIYIYQINRIFIINMFLQNEKLKFLLVFSDYIYFHMPQETADLFSLCMWKYEY